MFLLLRNMQTKDIEVVNVSAMHTAHAYPNPKFCDGTVIVWNKDGRYQRGSQFDTQRETLYDIKFDDFIQKIVDSGQMYWCA